MKKKVTNPEKNTREMEMRQEAQLKDSERYLKPAFSIKFMPRRIIHQDGLNFFYFNGAKSWALLVSSAGYPHGSGKIVWRLHHYSREAENKKSNSYNRNDWSPVVCPSFSEARLPLVFLFAVDDFRDGVDYSRCFEKAKKRNLSTKNLSKMLEYIDEDF